MTLPSATSIEHADRSFPRLHSRPESGWVNDPNGILYLDGRWHVFFQYNPASARHADICWGHMSSPDLLTWNEHPVALRPVPGGRDSFGCWSGVATIDDGVPALVYSGVQAGDDRSDALVVRGARDGSSWGPERVVAAEMPADPRLIVVRDPFLFELGGRRWALQGAGFAESGGALLLYDASDLDDWRECGILIDASDSIARDLPECDAWECPQLVRVGESWVLIVSLWRYNAPHRGVGYIVGDLVIDERSGLPVFSSRRAGILDTGSSFYAPQAVQSDGRDGVEPRVLLWGWAQEIAPAGVRTRSQTDNDDNGWSGLLTFPRELVVHQDAVESVPARELVALRGPDADPDELPDQAEIELIGPGAAELGLGDDAAVQVIWRGELADGEQIRLLIDASIVEVFFTGREAATYRAYPQTGERFVLRADRSVGLRAWQLVQP